MPDFHEPDFGGLDDLVSGSFVSPHRENITFSIAHKPAKTRAHALEFSSVLAASARAKPTGDERLGRRRLADFSRSVSELLKRLSGPVLSSECCLFSGVFFYLGGPLFVCYQRAQ